jgi:hypothetical protein
MAGPIRTGHSRRSKINALRDCYGVIDLDAKITHGALKLGVP